MGLIAAWGRIWTEMGWTLGLKESCGLYSGLGLGLGYGPSLMGEYWSSWA